MDELENEISGLIIRSQDADLSLALRGQADAYAQQSRAANTLRSYAYNWKVFATWCSDHEHTPMPASPETVRLFMTDMAHARKRKVATLSAYLATIATLHRLAGHLPPPTEDPHLRETMRGIRRLHGTAPRKKKPAEMNVLRQLVAATPTAGESGLVSARGVRDRAVLLLGFAGFNRPSEVAAFTIRDIREVEDGLTIRIGRSKTDQEGRGETRGIPYGSHPETCPVRAVRAWLRLLRAKDGPLFRPIDRHGNIRPQPLGPEAVADIVKDAARRAGFDPADFGGHSLRSGGATAAARGGAPTRAIMRQGRWKSERVANGYVHEGTLFEENAAAFTGL